MMEPTQVDFDWTDRYFNEHPECTSVYYGLRDDSIYKVDKVQDSQHWQRWKSLIGVVGSRVVYTKHTPSPPADREEDEE